MENFGRLTELAAQAQKQYANAQGAYAQARDSFCANFPERCTQEGPASRPEGYVTPGRLGPRIQDDLDFY